MFHKRSNRPNFTLTCAIATSAIFASLVACSSDLGEGDNTEDGSGGAGMSTGGAASGGQASSGGSAAGGDVGDSGGTTGSGGEPGAGGTDSGGSSSGGTTGSGGGPGDNGTAGCGTTRERPSPTQQQTIQVGNLTRYYLLYVPESYDPEKPLPLVFGIHGLNMNNVWAAHDSSGFQLIEATDDQALIVYPQGIQANGQSVLPSTQSQWGNADSNWGGPPPNANTARLNADLEYFDAIIDFMNENYCVDTEKVFAVGFSQGGFMTNALGCERASVFRGLAPVAGWGPINSNPTCSNPNAAHAVIQTQGDTDGTVTPQLGQATRDFWRARAGCEASSSPSSWGAGCVEYQGCDEDKPIVYCTHGGGHFVPSGAGARAWDFFMSLD